MRYILRDSSYEDLAKAMAAPGDIFARVDELEDCVANANYGTFYKDLLVLCKDISEEQKDRYFKKAALIMNGEHQDLQKQTRLRTIKSEDIDVRRRDCLDRALDLVNDISERYTSEFGGVENGL